MAVPIFVNCTFIKMMDFQHLTSRNAESKGDKMETAVPTSLDRLQWFQTRAFIISI